MADITAKLVNELRAKTGAAMMECKKMLVETAGDIEAAYDAFRKKGVKGSILERATTEGRVAVATSVDHKTSAAVEVVCNTDFTAKSETVEEVAQTAATKLAANPSVDLASDSDVIAALANASKVTGENVQLGRTAVVKGDFTGSYLYSTAGKGKIAVLANLTGAGNDEIVRALGMHVAAARPISLDRSSVPAELIAKEKEIAVEQAKATGKPQAMAEKIAEGKMNSFFAERVLLDQEFINGEIFKGKVSDMLKSKGATLTEYARLEVGQA